MGLLYLVFLVLCVSGGALGCGRSKAASKCPMPCACQESVDVHLTIQNILQPETFHYKIILKNTTKQPLIRQLELAAKTNPHFIFTSSFHHQWGYAIQSINGLSGDYARDKTYWEIIDVDDKHLQLGAGSYIPGHEEHVIFNFTRGSD